MGGGEGQRSLGCDSKQATDRYAGLVLEEEGWWEGAWEGDGSQGTERIRWWNERSVSRKSYLH